MTTNLYNNDSDIHVNQDVYDAFNSFIFSNDRNIFNKLIARAALYGKVEHLHGDIVECGVFKGSGMLSWLKLLAMYEPNSIKRVIGFDFFDNKFVNDDDQFTYETDQELMKQVFGRDKKLKRDDISIETVTQRIKNAGFSTSKFELIKGDIIDESYTYAQSHPGLKISLMYMDLDIDGPTYYTMQNFWNRMTSGGIIVFDEYAYGGWSESVGVDRFIKEYDLKLYNTNLSAPTAYIIKP